MSNGAFDEFTILIISNKKYRLMENFKFIVIVFNDKIDDSDFAMSSARDYSIKEELVESKLILNEEELLTLNTIWEIINDFNDSMIGLHEDDIIYSDEVKFQCIQGIEEYLADLEMGITEKKLIEQLLVMLRYAYNRHKNIYFLF